MTPASAAASTASPAPKPNPNPNPNPTANARTLDHYQGVITRLAGNSSSLKGWAVSVAMALVGFGAKDGPRSLALLAAVPILIFWLLDSYYLAAERAYRAKYNAAAASQAPAASIGSADICVADFTKALLTPVNAGVYLGLAIVAGMIGFGVIVLPRQT